MTTTADPIAKEVNEIKAFLEAKAAAQVQPLRDETDRIKAQVAELLKHQRELRRAELTASVSGHRPKVFSGPYQGMDLLDLAVARSLLVAQPREQQGLRSYTTMMAQWGANLKAAMDATTAASGDELVPTQEASVLWEDVNLETAVLPLFSRVNMPTNPFDIPLQMGDVNWYPGAENVATRATALTTAKQTLTAKELVSEVPWSYDLDEDAVIAMMEEVRRHLVRNVAEVIDDMLLNADTVTDTTNINSSTAITTSRAGYAHFLIGWDGMIKLPLVDNTGQRVDQLGAVTDDMFNKQRSKLDRFGVRPSELAFIMDINTYIRALSVTNFRTLDKFGPQATVLQGQLGAIEGIPVIVCEQMKLAATNGKVSDTGASNTTGRVLLVNRSQWRTGFRREMRIETERSASKRQNSMVVSFRLAFMERSGTRSTAKHTSLTFDITGVN